MVSYTSQIVKETSLFWLPYFEYHFMIANLVRLSLVVLKISDTSLEHTRGGALC